MEHVSRPRRIVLAVAALALLCGAGSPVKAETPAGLGAAPVFSRLDLQHKTVKLDAYRGKVVLLNFWATWCGPCLSEMPRFAAWQASYGGRGLQVIGISMDDTEAPVRALYQKQHLNFPVVMGDANLGELYGGILGLPVTYVIDRKGTIRFKYQGATDLTVIEREIETVLARQ